MSGGFCAGLGAVVQRRSTSGPGTRLLVLGECGRRASILCRAPRRRPDLWGRQQLAAGARVRALAAGGGVRAGRSGRLVLPSPWSRALGPGG